MKTFVAFNIAVSLPAAAAVLCKAVYINQVIVNIFI